MCPFLWKATCGSTSPATCTRRTPARDGSRPPCSAGTLTNSLSSEERGTRLSSLPASQYSSVTGAPASGTSTSDSAGLTGGKPCLVHSFTPHFTVLWLHCSSSRRQYSTVQFQDGGLQEEHEPQVPGSTGGKPTAQQACLSTLQYSAVHHSAVQCSTVYYSTVMYSTFILLMHFLEYKIQVP